MRRCTPLLLAIGMFLVGCTAIDADDPSPPLGDEVGVVSGIVLAGPQCPVQTDPPTPGCEDTPVVGAEMLVWEKSWTDAVVVVSGADGAFELELEPGSYLFEPQPYEGLLGTAPLFEIEVVGGGRYPVTVPYDTGIR